MKNLFFSLVFLFPALANAKAWRVDNTGNPAAQFSSLSTAIAASTVAAGDTLYLYGSATSYGSVAVNKRLVILGMGYNWAVNYLSAIPIAQIDCMNFAAGSEGSLISGMRIGTGTAGDALYLSVDGITVKRNYVSSIHAASSTSACPNPSSSVNRQAVISQNWIYGYNNYTSSNYTGLYNIYGTIDHNLIAYRMQVPLGSIISHNVVCYSNRCSSSSYLNYFSGSVIENNIFWGTTSNRVVNAFGSVLRNNVFDHASTTSVGDGSNNLENNVFSATMSNVFENSSNTSLDGNFRLKTGSPALAAGTGGVDIGAFGGTGAYVLGLPPTVPIIYFFNSAVNASTSLPIEIRIISK
ncbi:MAG TPA: hypothetical protein PLL64_12785 [Rhodothermales bacterium]|nr:hypothetical protein [Rhodothermales bacterium]HRR08156.1 hypothetical protein [Rhodothermales bacterium]